MSLATFCSASFVSATEVKESSNKSAGVLNDVTIPATIPTKGLQPTKKGPQGPKGVVRSSEGPVKSAAYAYYYVNAYEMVGAGATRTPPTFSMVEWQADGPNTVNKIIFADGSAGSFDVVSGDVGNPTWITGIKTPFTGWYRISINTLGVQALSSGFPTFALVVNGSVVQAPIYGNPNTAFLTDFTVKASVIGQASQDVIVFLNAGDMMRVIDVSVDSPEIGIVISPGPTKLPVGPDGAAGVDTVPASITIEFLGNC